MRYPAADVAGRRMLLRDSGVQILDPLFSPSKWILLCDTLLAAGPASR